MMEANNMSAKHDILTEIKGIANSALAAFSLGNYPASCLWDIIRKCDAALAAPLRNCEVGTAEEQARQFLTYCVKQDCEKTCPFRDCKNSYECAFGWAQMPYEKGGAS
jgi:hypothetical protein